MKKNNPFFYKFSDKAPGYIKVVTHPGNARFMADDGWKESAEDVKPPRKRRTKAELGKGGDDGDSSSGH